MMTTQSPSDHLPLPVRHPQLERALERLCGTRVRLRVEMRPEGVLITRDPFEDPYVTAGRIEDEIEALRDHAAHYRGD